MRLLFTSCSYHIINVEGTNAHRARAKVRGSYTRRWHQQQRNAERSVRFISIGSATSRQCQARNTSISTLRRADRPSMVLIDARSSAERSISIIPGAISLAEFEQNIVTTLSPDASVVVYCTIGYRSGIEARRLKEKLDGLDGRIQNLDGIVPYTHAIGDMSDQSMQLIKPDTGERTNVVHMFGRTWNCVHSRFETVHFNAPELALRSSQAGLVSTLRFIQHLLHKTKQRCTCY